jgi:hypothetical protein
MTMMEKRLRTQQLIGHALEPGISTSEIYPLLKTQQVKTYWEVFSSFSRGK